MPEKAELIFTSEPGIKQGYRLGSNVLALQCHLEMTPEGVKTIIENCRHELVADTYVQTEEDILKETSCYSDNQKLLTSLLEDLMKGWEK